MQAKRNKLRYTMTLSLALAGLGTAGGVLLYRADKARGQDQPADAPIDQPIPDGRGGFVVPVAPQPGQDVVRRISRSNRRRRTSRRTTICRRSTRVRVLMTKVGLDRRRRRHLHVRPPVLPLTFHKNPSDRAAPRRAARDSAREPRVFVPAPRTRRRRRTRPAATSLRRPQVLPRVPRPRPTTPQRRRLSTPPPPARSASRVTAFC
jgi:hypothetical protein